jgi:hypothetical protein
MPIGARNVKIDRHTTRVGSAADTILTPSPSSRRCRLALTIFAWLLTYYLPGRRSLLFSRARYRDTVSESVTREMRRETEAAHEADKPPP